MGAVLAGSPALPVITEIMGEVAIEQGRLDDQGHDLKSLQRKDDTAEGGMSAPPKQPIDADDDDLDAIQFVLNLESISQRLLVVPRPARVSALRAELTMLNHKLPAEGQICMPMWCHSTDAPQGPNKVPAPHHKIVRIPPGECVVLNSAEHTPYLLLIEILNGELDFDPTKRGNKAVLQKIVIKENERKGASRDIIPFTTAASPSKPKPIELVNDSDAAFGKETPEMSDIFVMESSTGTSHAEVTSPSGDDEEIDLVEQLYGAEESLRSRAIDISESIVLPPAPKNKDLDIAAWSRISSIPPSPIIDNALPTISPRINTSASIIHRSSSSRSHIGSPQLGNRSPVTNGKTLSLEDYSERMRTAAVMLAQLNASMVWESVPSTSAESSSGPLGWLPGTNWFSILPATPAATNGGPIHPSLAGVNRDGAGQPARMKLQPTEAAAIRDRIMTEMLALEEERMERMRENRESEAAIKLGIGIGDASLMEDEGIIRRELNKEDPSAVVFSESWATKKSRVRQGSPYGHLASWDCLSVIVKTGDDLRQEQLAVQLIQEFKRIWQEENCQCWVRYFRILITGGSSGLVETITDAVSIHSIKKAEYARRLAEGRLGHVTLMDHFKSTYGSPSSARFARAQRNFAKSLAGYSIVTYLLQIKDRHNGNILLDREGHLIHIDFGFMLSNSPGNIGFEASPFKLPFEYVEVLGGVNGEPLREFRRLFREGFEAARKHCDRIITMVELMQKDSALPCFAAFGEQTAVQLRERFQQALTHSFVAEHVDKLIDTSLGSHWTRLYDSYQYYSQSILS
ncbi:hypothetical protein EWM64_g1386 [Hericium alpestre]|uniref:1-phosphatidylinositol 4-kinase n=1 Tax=Hericium alpestre TaxID=135208 RepID=A0A4Z0A8L8_9AGAM|nr:hypothetical protein EWM64_g1386 [Hericium alpestre]